MITTQRHVTFLYTNNELSEREKEKNNKIKSKRIKYKGINLTKEGKYSENYEILMKEIENDAKKSKDTL